MIKPNLHKNHQTFSSSTNIRISARTMRILIAILCLFSSIGQQFVAASGVFELEFIKLQQLDTRQTSVDTTNSSKINRMHDTQAVNSNKDNPTDLIRVLVCLKEAFTSQLDGPCTFGNASITLSRDSIQQHLEPTTPSSINRDSSLGKIQTSAQQQQQGSLLTNIVRILFTFRWTVSCYLVAASDSFIDYSSVHFVRLSFFSKKTVWVCVSKVGLPVSGFLKALLVRINQGTDFLDD